MIIEKIIVLYRVSHKVYIEQGRKMHLELLKKAILFEIRQEYE